MDLDVWTKVNDRFEQQGNTSDMLFAAYVVLAYFSRYMRMVPGDVLATGTPPGVGMGKNRHMADGESWSAVSRTWARSATKSLRNRISEHLA